MGSSVPHAAALRDCAVLCACRHEPTPRRAAWILRQAGRYMPEYRAMRARHTLLEICRRPQLAAEVTITAAEYLGVDAAIVFADLLLPVEALGLQLSFTAGEGPVVTPALRHLEQIQRLPRDWQGGLGYVAETVNRVAQHFRSRLPVIGFVGAPFTLASYLIEGGGSRHYIHTKRLMCDPAGSWQQLMERLCAGLAGFAAGQVAAGASAIQLFDSWAGALSESDYRRYVLPHNRQLVRQIQQTGAPVIYFSTATGAYLPAVAETGAEVLGLDWRIELATAWERLSRMRPLPALQGNLDPVALLADPETLRERVAHMLDQARGHAGYIFNLGHGVLPETDPETVRALVQWVHEYR